MLKQISVCAAVLMVATTHALDAQQRTASFREQARAQSDGAPDIRGMFVTGSFPSRFDGRSAITPFLVATRSWLAQEFQLPITDELPKIEFASPAKIATRRYGSPAGGPQDRASGFGQSTVRDVVSVYIDATRTIFLPEDWSGATPKQLSILVHEMVHHLQNVGKLKFECPEERESLAYRAQERWLGLFGHDLMHDFGMDGFALLVKTKCFY